MAKRTTGGRKSRSRKTKTAVDKDIVESTATDVTDAVEDKIEDVTSEIETTAETSDVEAIAEDVADVDTKAELETDESTASSFETVEADTSTPPTDEIVYSAAPAAEQVVVRKGGFVPMLLGGVVAAGLGFAAAETDVLGSSFGSSSQDETVDLTPVNDQLNAQAETIAALEAQLAGMEAPEAPDLSAVDENASQIAAVSAKMDSVSETIGSLEDRLTEMEKAPVSDAVSPAAIAAYERELAALSESVAKQREEVEAMLTNAKAVEEEANEAAQTAEAKLALSSVISAIDAGGPFESELEALKSAGGPDVPEALAAVAETGVPTLASLQESFPGLARQALASARANAPEEEGSGGIGSFLQRSLGARSTTPREGNSADAVLSRAEAALKDGDVETTLAEVEKLPEDAKTIMADWLAQAAARLEARTAADALSASLNSN